MVLIEVFIHFVCEITEGEAKEEIWSSVNYLFFISTLWIYRRNQLIRQATLRLIFKPGHHPPPHHGLLTYGPSSPFRSFNHTIPCLMIEVPQENSAKEADQCEEGYGMGPSDLPRNLSHTNGGEF